MTEPMDGTPVILLATTKDAYCDGPEHDMRAGRIDRTYREFAAGTRGVLRKRHFGLWIELNGGFRLDVLVDGRRASVFSYIPEDDRIYRVLTPLEQLAETAL